MVAQTEILQKIYAKYGYDFRDYNPELITRRMDYMRGRERFPNDDQFHKALLEDPQVFAELVDNVTINVTSMFRDPVIWQMLREEVLPRLDSYPRIRIWSAGAAGGQEAFSLAILLKELGLLHKSIIYATDIDAGTLERASQGVLPLHKVAEYSVNYRLAGGSQDFSEYYTTRPHVAHINDELLKNIVFCTHSLATDGVFNEFQLILCRNVMIYFNKRLINRVLELFKESLSTRGTLCIGSQESLAPYEGKKYFDAVKDGSKFYRRVF